jgi:hypothetical protein
MTTFIDTSALLSGQEADDQDPVVVVVRSAQGMLREGLGESASATFETAFAEKYAAKEWSSIFDLLLGNSEVIFEKIASVDEAEAALRVGKTAEGYFEVVLSIMSKMETVEDVVGRIHSFVRTMSTPSSSSAVQSVKLKLLVTLLASISPKAQLRISIINGLCRFAAGNEKMSNQVYALVKDVDSWIVENEWEVEDSAKLELFAYVRGVAPAADAIEFLKKEVAIASGDAKTNLAETLVVSAVKTEGYFGFADLESLPVSPAANNLVKILAEGTFADMESFASSAEGKTWLASASVEAEVLLEKMRVMALISLVGTSRKISMKSIAESLKTNDAFSVVVRAIRAGLIRGSIDEVEGVVIVTGVVSRNLKSVLKTVAADVSSIAARLA